jgi:hypothetical protein
MHICKTCGKEFKGRQKCKANKYCSKQCQFIGFKNRVIIKCKSCGKEFEVPKSRENIAKNCSYKCMGKSMLGKVPKSAWEKGRTPWNKDKKCDYLIGNKNGFSKGHIPWNSGIIWKEMSGAANPAWNGGTSFLPYPSNFNSQLKERVRVRDNFICKLCGIPELECEEKLSIHHIDYNKNNSKMENLISLCNKCHLKTNTNRKYWENYLKKGDCYGFTKTTRRSSATVVY